jgi:putative inorganic carbon (HCO3(-)) transporter
MTFSLRPYLELGYLAAVLLLGGASAAGLGGNALLGLGGAALIGLTIWREAPGDGTRTGLHRFLIALLALAAFQFLPLPPGIWRHLPGRETIAAGFDLAGMAAPWLTVSLDPWGTLQSLLWWIPALALFLVFRSKGAVMSRHVIALIAVFAYASVVLAVAQYLGGSGYFYAITNRGNGVGLFANSNHFGSFMLLALALVAGQWIHDKPALMRTSPKLATGYALIARLAPFALGVFLSNSLACAILIWPVLAGVWLLYRPQTKVSWPVVALGLPLLAVAMVWLLSSGVVSNDLMAKSGTVGISRGEFLANGLEMARSFAPLGSGIGTFREIYPWFEELAVVGTTFVNHAHNDLLELVIETGLPGLAVLGLFLHWYGARLRDLWANDRERNPVAIAAALGIGAVLIHCLADYPLRTAAISGLFGLCAVIMSRPPENRGSAPGAKVDTKRDELLTI